MERPTLVRLLLGCAQCALLLCLPDQPVLAAPGPSGATLVAAARAQVGITLGYDGSYRRLDYPGGDVPIETGVCTDVVVRAFRILGVDLQVAVHEDMRAHFARYPQHWGLRRPDRNIDHRRVPNLETWLRRQGAALSASDDPADYQPGDIVSWRLPGGLPHIGIVSDRHVDGRPLILHNIGAGAREEDILFAYPIEGRFRWLPPALDD
ncbi:MAG: DUF1287 domain-containing protein [Lysobacteraceae bacterium SCN 69-123]|nr:MAG: DUF1287 domain-containing protein [Xanthomonadaceae bacterium SCN 69-123]